MLEDSVAQINEDRPSRFQRYQAGLETALIFAVFFLQGAWPAPAANEAHYLGKAIHYWDPSWIPDDFFLNSSDTHKVFYFTLGWMSLVLAPLALAWTGRVMVWGLMAWAWRRLSRALLPQPWMAVLTAALFALLQDRYQLAGEWVIGGVEAKGFAYVLVFLGLAALVEGRWNLAWLWFGGASAFHVLVGGWSVVAAGVAWVGLRKDRPALVSMMPGLAAGFALSLPGLLPSVGLTWGVEPEVVSRANSIYVLERLSHHLVPSCFALVPKIRFGLLVATWLVVSWMPPASAALRRLRWFVLGSLAIALAGVAIDVSAIQHPALRASLLKLYWFRLSDAAVPIGVALAAGNLLVWLWKTARPLESPVRNLAVGCGVTVGLLAAAWGLRRVWYGQSGVVYPREVTLAAAMLIFGVALWPLVRRWGVQARGVNWWLAAAMTNVALLTVVAPALHVAGYARFRAAPTVPPADPPVPYFGAWVRACRWIADHPQEVPPDARFFTPFGSQTFKWYAGRSEVATWKDISQDPRSIVQWRDRLAEIYGTGNSDPGMRWHASLARSFTAKGPAEVERLGQKYGADYVLTVRWPRLNLEVLYENEIYVIYRIEGAER